MQRKYKDFELTIFGLKVPVIFQERVHDRHGNEAAGMFALTEETNSFAIFLSLSANKTHYEMTVALGHELGHACIYRLGLHNTNLSHDIEEVIVDGIGVALAENFDIDF